MTAVSAPPVLARVSQRLSSRVALPAVFGMLGFVVCATFSWIPSLWGDEAASVLSARRPLGSLLHMLQHVDAVHGTYYAFLHFWIDAFGAGPFSVRLPSAIAVGLAVAGVVSIAHRMSGRQAAIVVGVLACVLPRLTYAGEEARSYAASAAVAVWLTLLLLVLLDRPHDRKRILLGYGALLVVGVYLFLYTLLLPLAHVVILLATSRGRRLLRAYLATCLAALALASPVVLAALLERRQIAYLAVVEPITDKAVFYAPWFDTVLFTRLGWATIVASALIAIVHRRHPRPPDRLLLVALTWLLIPSGLLIAASYALHIYTARYLTFCAPAVPLAMAPAVLWLGSRFRAVSWVAVALIIAVALPSWQGQRGPESKNGSDWAELSALVGEHAAPGEGIVFDESIRPSRRPRLALRTYPSGFRGLVDVQLRTPYWNAITWHDVVYPLGDSVVKKRLSTLSIVWVVDYGHPADRSGYGITTLSDLGYAIDHSWKAPNSTIYRLERRVPEAGSTASSPARASPATG